MGWKKMLIGEKMPDKDDPQYRKRYEDEVNAGKVQHFAIGHQKAFLIIVFGFIAFSFSLNIYRMGRVWSFRQTAVSAIERQDEMIRNRHRRIREAVSSNHVKSEKQENNIKTNKDNDGHTEED